MPEVATATQGSAGAEIDRCAGAHSEGKRTGERPSLQLSVSAVLWFDPAVPERLAAGCVRSAEFNVPWRGFDFGVTAAQESAHFTRVGIAQHEDREFVGVPDDLKAVVGQIRYVHRGLQLGTRERRNGTMRSLRIPFISRGTPAVRMICFAAASAEPAT